MKGMLLVTVFALWACSSGSTSTVEGHDGGRSGRGGESGSVEAGAAGDGDSGMVGAVTEASGGSEGGSGGTVAGQPSGGTQTGQGGTAARGGEGVGGEPVASGGSGEGGAQGVGGAIPVDCTYPEDAGKIRQRVCSEADGTRTCQTGECIKCPLDSLDCDGNPSNGCETPRSYDQCLGCNFPCTGTKECITKLGTNAVTGEAEYYKACG